MKRLLAAILLAAWSSLAFGEEIQVLRSGKYQSPIYAYKVGPRYYINAKDAAALYDGQLYWYPAAGRVRMSFRGKAVQFLEGSDTAAAEDRKFKMDAKMIVRTGQAFIPVSLLHSEAFSSWIGKDAEFNAHTRLLTVDARSTVGPVSWYSYADFSRIVVELGENHAYNCSARGVGGFDLTVPLGVIEASERASIGDGVISDFELKQEAKLARLSVRYARGGSSWQARELSGPRRLVLDVYKEGAPLPAAQAGAAKGKVVAGNIAPKTSAPARPAAGAKKTELAKVEDKAPRETAVSSAAQVTSRPKGEAEIASVVTVKGPAKRRIVIDAGHGGKDSGAVGARGTYEKDLNLSAALELAKLLRQEDAFEVLLTRTNDTFIPLGDRSRMSNEFDADLFISLHCNASRNKGDSGYEIYFLSERASDPEAERLAEFENSVLELEGKSASDEEASALLIAMTKTEHINAASELAGRMTQSLSRRVDLDNRGVKQAAFYVLRGTNAPAVLFEMAYVSNKKDEAKLESAKYRRKIIDGVYAGILDYSKHQGWLAQ